MVGRSPVDINDAHFELIAEAGEQIALVASIYRDDNCIAGLYSFHQYEDTFMVEQGYPPGPDDDRFPLYPELLRYSGDPGKIVKKKMESVIDDQEYSDSEGRFEWELVYATPEVKDNDSLMETLERTVGPERLEPDFDVPDDEPVVTLDIGYGVHDIIKRANEFHVGLPVDIERHRGESYFIGLTEERAQRIADACTTIKQKNKDDGFYEGVEEAGRAARELRSVNPE